MIASLNYPVKYTVFDTPSPRGLVRVAEETLYRIAMDYLINDDRVVTSGRIVKR